MKQTNRCDGYKIKILTKIQYFKLENGNKLN